jgi:hypothetical protein
MAMDKTNSKRINEKFENICENIGGTVTYDGGDRDYKRWFTMDADEGE